jgi:ABC-type sugar transport system permease subunit
LQLQFCSRAGVVEPDVSVRRSTKVSAVQRREGRWSRLRWLGYLTPAVALTGLFIVYPAIRSVQIAFLSWPGYGPTRNVGFGNFTGLWHDAVARSAVFHSLIYATLLAGGTVVVGTVIAIAIDRKVVGHTVFKFLIFLPVLLPTTFIGLAWANGFDSYLGWVNPILSHVGLSHAWLSNPDTIIYAVVTAAILAGTGFPMIVVLAALGDIPQEIHEAATLDGVSSFQRAWKISVPLVREVLATLLLLQFIFGMGQFDFVYVMTNGGPGVSSEVISTFVYHQAFDDHRFGYAAAASLVMSLMIALLALLYMTAFRARGMTRAG